MVIGILSSNIIKDNPIANLSYNWDIVLIFDVLKHSLCLFDHSF